MGLANLVPGVSGGTLILALGLYDRFISAIADVTRLKLSRGAILFLALVAIGGLLSILSLAGVAVHLISDYRWVMYSLFIGLALGGVPEIVPLCRPFDGKVIVSVLAGLGVMAFLAWGFEPTSIPHNMIVFALVGALAASSMILPGISGSYILLILGMYDVVVGSLSREELADDLGGSLRIIVPVGVGAALGIAVLSNVLKVLLARFSRPSHGVLLGLLFGSVLGLFPFQESVHADLADKPWRKSVVMLLEGKDLEAIRERYEVTFTETDAQELRVRFAGMTPADLKRMGDELRTYQPELVQILGALGLIAAGYFGARMLGSGERKPTSAVSD